MRNVDAQAVPGPGRTPKAPHVAPRPGSGRASQALTWVAGTGRERGRVGWFALLLAAICFEGLGRKYLASIPAILFYFAKDVVLVGGILAFGARSEALAAARSLYRAFVPVLALAVIWTVAQMFNPSQPSLALAFVGLRAYWLWWFAPGIIANALPRAEDRRRGLVVLALMGIFIALYAWAQFNSPGSDAINSTTFYDGEARADIAFVSSTGRVRVSSTFAYLSGFADFGVLIPTLLLAYAIDSRNRVMRIMSIAAGALIVVTVAMTGSRMAFGLSALGVMVVAMTSGFIRTRAGRWAVGLTVAGIALLFSFGDVALQGVRDRWGGEDTAGRLGDVLLVLPPVALAISDYPPMGIGTGMQQNARLQLGADSIYMYEEESPRWLVELGVPGFVLVWLARFGLVVALVRVARTLRGAGQRGAASAALAFAALTMFGRATFDHVWQALYFVGLGLLLSHYVSVLSVRRALAPQVGKLPRP